MKKKILSFLLVVGLLLLINPVRADQFINSGVVKQCGFFDSNANIAGSLPKSSSVDSSYVYRFWSDVFKGHFYTISYDEAVRVNDTDTNWKYEKVAFSAYATQKSSSIPLYRFWSDVFKGHFYTADADEMVRVRDTDSNWKYEMIAYDVYPASYTGSAKTVYRFWSPVFKHHFYTSDESEMIRVRDTDSNWTYEGPAYKVPEGDVVDNLKLYQVTQVVDGDTIKVNIDGVVETLRLIGIDTPEVVDPRKVVQCFGQEASNKAKSVLTGQSVALEADASQGERDKYDRLLRYVFLADGTNYNKMMVEQGYAHEYTYNLPYKYQSEFKQAETYASNNQLGLWSPATCNGDTTQPANSTPMPFPTIQPTSTPTPTPSGAIFVCDCLKPCSAIATCEEAYYQLNTCGCAVRDGDSDGVPCESIC